MGNGGKSFFILLNYLKLNFYASFYLLPAFEPGELRAALHVPHCLTGKIKRINFHSNTVYN